MKQVSSLLFACALARAAYAYDIDFCKHKVYQPQVSNDGRWYGQENGKWCVAIPSVEGVKDGLPACKGHVEKPAWIDQKPYGWENYSPCIALSYGSEAQAYQPTHPSFRGQRMSQEERQYQSYQESPYTQYPQDQTPTFPIVATVILQKDGAWTSDVKGSVTLRQESADQQTTFDIQIEGLTAGKHGFHVHEFGPGAGWNCTTAGGHYNPLGQTHGAKEAEVRHVGDLGNIEANNEGKVATNFPDNIIDLYGPSSVIGRTIVVHADADDLGLGGFEDSKTTGHAGKRVACGIIAYAKA
ncbi:hypothetical protein HK097_001335 [Rhizophlyctis rosea]|uniref:Superoxide dismutase [Cu-Zn] n=1 Tax=Rhizophlyctis rosea TaxID=64517 RepID=A0AAD5SN87_9FUNG|nr:hypothetical protein HK097_001335 [Rhizophlyctis rosea]